MQYKNNEIKTVIVQEIQSRRIRIGERIWQYCVLTKSFGSAEILPKLWMGLRF